MEQPNRYRAAWEKLEKELPLPRRLGKAITVQFDAFAEKIKKQEPTFVQEIVQSLYAGDVYILKGALPAEFMICLRQELHIYGQSTASKFYKMLEGVPNFHRVIDKEVAKNYSFEAIKHSYYFFPWNKNPYNLFEITYPRWRLIKFLSGLQAEEYEKNTPKDGVVDRIQIVQYPSGTGKIETHSDPYQHQRLIIACFMSKRGKDYTTGGVYFIDQNNNQVDMEDQLDIGDMQIYFPTVLHGVATIDEGKTPDWSSSVGRWWFGPFSNSSNHLEKRHMGFGVKNVKDVL